MIALNDTFREIGIQGVGGLLAGAILLVLGYEVLERKLHANERLADWQADRERVADARRSVLRAVHRELESNAGSRSLAIRTLLERRVPYPLFDTRVLEVAFDAAFIPAMTERTVDAFVNLVSRLHAANKLHAQLFDMWRGSSSVLAGLAVAPHLDIPEALDAYEAFHSDRITLMNALIRRCENLGEPLFDAIDAVEHDLGITGSKPARERDYDANAELVQTAVVLETLPGSEASGPTSTGADGT